MDVQYQLEFTNTHQKDTYMQTRMAAVSIVPVEQERVNDFTVHTDSTTIPASGTIRRVITATLTADFLTRFPTENDRRAALKDAFKNVFGQMLPAQITESISFV